VTVLPHILDSSAAERKQQLAMLKKVAKRLKSQPFRYVWTEAGKQADLADQLDMGGAGYPALVGLSVSKERYSNMRAAFDEEHVVQFLNNLMSGKEPLGPIRKMPAIADAQPWDGKDGEQPKDEL
jgi:protein disulfide-isomerase A6